MAYNEAKAKDRFERMKQQLIQQKQMVEQLNVMYEKMETPVPPPRSLLEQWRAGEVGLGPHLSYQGGVPSLLRLTCIGCGCCRMMPKHLYCEQCLIGRRPFFLSRR